MTRQRLWLTWLAIAVAVAIAACGAPALTANSPPAATAPLPAATAPLLSTPAPSPLPNTGGGGFAPQPAIVEERFIEIEWPSAIRLGDSDFIRLSLVPGPEGSLKPTAEAEGHETEGEPIAIPNLYDTHNVLAVAELSGVGFEIDRAGEIGQPLLPGESAQWTWTIHPKSAGEQVLTLTLKLRFVPKSGGETLERAVWAKLLNVEGRTVLGLSGRAADLLGVLGTISGGLLGFPFADKVYEWLWRRIFPKRRGALSKT